MIEGSSGVFVDNNARYVRHAQSSVSSVPKEMRVTEATHRASVERFVTHERLGPYLLDTGGDYTRAEALYVWNLRVSGAFHEVLGIFEVALRNALCEQLRAWHGKRPGTWLDDPTAGLDDRRVEDITVASQRLADRNKPNTEGRVVAELTFGFWRYLLAKRYHNSLWIPHLRLAFPGMKPQRRDVVYEIVEALHTLRNRVAHHEPIHRYPLSKLHDLMLRATSWVDPPMATWLAHLRRVPDILRDHPETTR